MTHSGVGALLLAFSVVAASVGINSSAALVPTEADSGGQPGELIVAASPEAATAAGLTVIGEVGFGWTLVDAPGSIDLQGGGGIAALPGVEVEPNLVYELADEPLFPDQWSLENTGQTGGRSDADIDILEAWTRTTGEPEVVVAVLDSGVALAHSDLSPNLWANSDELDGNGIDDDGNGYVDDVQGWDALDVDADPSDTNGHGTFVATTAVASVNSVGMAGVAPGAALMPIRVCDDNGCPLSAIITGLDYAMANGAAVANLSFGGNFSASAALEGAVQAVIDNGTVVVAAAGNQGRNNDLIPFYPASFDIDGLISVAASHQNDGLTSFSNFGPTSVDLAAPGESVVGGLPPNTWGFGSGTSFAAPHVTGVVALIRALRSDLSPAAIEVMVRNSVDTKPTFAGRVSSGGRLNAGSATELATAPVAVAKASPSTGTLPFSVQLSGGQSFDPVGVIVSRSWKLPDGSVVNSTNTSWKPRAPGTYKATLTVVDDDGLRDTATVTITARLRSGGTFVDDDGHFAEGAIEAIAAEGITQGCNPPRNDRYCPQGEVTRGQMAAFLARALGLPSASRDFFDDDDSSVFENAINKLAAAGITQGCNPPVNDLYCPDELLTRGEMAAFLARAFRLVGGAGADLFVDDDGSIFEHAIDKIATAGITTGCNPPTNDRYCPDSATKRGEMAVFLSRALNLSPIYPPASE